MKKHGMKIIGVLLILAWQLLPAAAGEKAVNARLKGFAEFVSKVQKEWKVPGLAVSITKDGKLVYAEGFGLRNVKSDLKVTPKTLFAIGSCSKAFTAMDVGILVDEGRLDWDIPVHTYMPGFKMKDQTASEQMTPRDLLCHRSGLPRHDLVWYGSGFTRQEMFERLQYLEPNKPFRSLWQYQNLMFMTAGYLVEKVSGKTWESFTRERIFGPLGMKESNFSVTDSAKAADYALPYQEIKEKVQEIPFRNIDAIGPAGSINSNILEMAEWVLLNINKGKAKDKQVVSEGSMGQIHSPQMVVPQPIQYNELLYSTYGMGWMITPYRGHLLLQHGGGIDGFSALVAFMPNEKIGIVVLTNSGGTPLTQIVAYNAFDRLLNLPEVPWNKRLKEQLDKAKEALEKTKKDQDNDRIANTVPSHSLDDYCGEYEHPGYGVITVAKEGTALKAVFHSSSYKVDHFHYDVFKFSDDRENEFKGLFAADKKGVISSLALQLDSSTADIVFTRLPEKKMLSKEFLQKFVGKYEIMGQVVNVQIKGEKTLILTVPGQPDYELVPYKGTTFNFKALSGFSIEFKLDAAGNATEIIFNQPNGVFTAKRKN